MGKSSGPDSVSAMLLKAVKPARFAAIVSYGFLCGFAVVAQKPGLRTTNTIPTQSSQDAATIRTNVRQVVVDVVVTDNQDHPIKGLKQEDFSVFEDDLPQKIIYFEAHTSSPDSARLKPVAVPVPSRTFVNVAVTDDHLPLSVLLFDVLNTPPDEQPYAREQVGQFLSARPPGSRYAIFVLADKLRLIQGFTDDERQLVAAMDSKYASALHATAGELLTASQQRYGVGTLAGESALPGASELVDSSEAAIRDYYRGQRMQRTIAAFKEIARFLSGLSGRKNLIWLSGSFPTGMFTSGNLRNPISDSSKFAPDLLQAENLLAMAQVAVYPVDARGLTSDPSFGGRGGGMRGGEPTYYWQSIEEEHGTMDEIAEQTGGHAFYNTNGLAQAIATSTNEGSNYYSLSYNPTNTRFDGRVRRIRVKFPSNGFHISYRRSYIAFDDSVIAQETAIAPAIRIHTALIRGAPLAHDIVLQVYLNPQGMPSIVTQKQIDMLSQFPAYAQQKTWDKVLTQHYVIEYGFLGGRISFQPRSDGRRNGIFEVQLAAFDKDDELLYFQWTRIEKAYSAQEFADIQTGAYRLRQETDIPSDAAWLRLAVRDAIGEHLGSIEIPLPVPPKAHENSKPNPN